MVSSLRVKTDGGFVKDAKEINPNFTQRGLVARLPIGKVEVNTTEVEAYVKDMLPFALTQEKTSSLVGRVVFWGAIVATVAVCGIDAYNGDAAIRSAIMSSVKGVLLPFIPFHPVGNNSAIGVAAHSISRAAPSFS